MRRTTRHTRRSMRRLKSNFTLTDIVNSKRKLHLVIWGMTRVFTKMGIHRCLCRFPVRFGIKEEFQPSSSGFYNRKEIVARRRTPAIVLMCNLAHEFGHEATFTGGFGRKSNLLGETTAFSFQNEFLKKFNSLFGLSLRRVYDKPIWNYMIFNPLYCFSELFALFIPLGKMIQRKYLIDKSVVHMNLIARYSYIPLESIYHCYRKG